MPETEAPKPPEVLVTAHAYDGEPCESDPDAGVAEPLRCICGHAAEQVWVPA